MILIILFGRNETKDGQMLLVSPFRRNEPKEVKKQDMSFNKNNRGKGG